MSAGAVVTASRPPAVELPIVAFALHCGARLVVSPRPGAPVAAVQMHMRGGVALDPQGREGTAWLSGALLDQGTARHSEEEIATLLESAGGNLSGDANGVSGSIASKDWRRLVELVAELVTAPTYPAARVQRQRQRMLDRLLVERDDPRVQGEHHFRRLVYGDHWLGRPSYGGLESVRRIQRSHLSAFHRKCWMPQRALFALCGDVDPEEVRALFDRRLASWKRGDDLPPPEPVFPPRAVRQSVFQSERAQVHLHVGHLGIRRNHPDYPALVVMDHVLGTGPGFTNRISKRLRDELGLAYTVHASIHHNAGIHPGTFTAYIGTSPQHVETALGGFLDEIRRLQAELVGDDELGVAKDYVVGSFALSFQRAVRRAAYMISHERHGLPPDNLQRMPRELAAVSADDVRRVAREHLHPGAVCVAAAGPLTEKDVRSAVERALERGAGVPVG